jgi:transcriptional regulator with XRE-family HTH domain
MIDIGQQELARMVGVTPATVSRWEDDRRRPRDAALVRLAAALRVTPEYLAYGVLPAPVAGHVAPPLYYGEPVVTRAASVGEEELSLDEPKRRRKKRRA